MKQLKDQSRRPGWSFLLALVFWVAIWQIAYLLVGSDFLLASPVQVLSRLGQLVLKLSFWQTTGLSLVRILIGFILGVAAGSLLAVLTVSVRLLSVLFEPAIRAIRATPVASFIILALVWMTNNRVVVFIVFLMVMPIVWANVTEGIRKTDPQLLEMAHLFGFSNGQVIRLIYIPQILPFFVAAVTTALGLGWKAGVAAEVLSSPELSLGGELYKAKIYLETADLIAYTIVIIIVSLVLEKVLLWTLGRTQGYFRQHGRTGLEKGGGRP